MTRALLRAKGREPKDRFAGIPHAVMDHACYTTLSHKAARLLLDLAKQYNSVNNGDLSAAWSQLHERGWNSRDTLGRAIQELVDHSLILKTRQGGRNKCNLYALTWRAIDECKGKLDIASTRTPPGDWQRWEPKSIQHDRESSKVSPAVGQAKAA